MKVGTPWENVTSCAIPSLSSSTVPEHVVQVKLPLAPLRLPLTVSCVYWWPGLLESVSALGDAELPLADDASISVIPSVKPYTFQKFLVPGAWMLV